MKKSNKHFLQNTIVLAVLASFCCMLWGSAFPFIKIGYSLLQIGSADTASQILFAGVRFFVAGLLTVSAGSVIQRKWLRPSKDSFKRIVPLGLVQTVAQYLFFYIGLAHTDGTRASIINGTNVFLALLVSCFVFKCEKFTAAKLAGCLVGFAGIVAINLSGGAVQGGSFTGDACIIASVIAHSFSSSMIKIYSSKDDPVMLSGWQFSFGGAVMIIAGLLCGGRLELSSWQGAAVLAELALVSAIAYTVWGLLLKYNEVSRVLVFGCLTPVFGFFMSAALLGENNALSWQSLLALALVCSGIVIINLKAKEKEKAMP